MTVEFKETKVLTEADRIILFEWGADIFGTAAMNLQWRAKDLHFIVYDDGKPVSHAGILRHTVNIGKMPKLVGGLGGVVTVPRSQRQGLARRLVLQAMKVLENEWKVDAGLLFCMPHMTHYYESLGWKLVDSTVSIDQPNGKIISPMLVMVLTFGDSPWPEGPIDLQSFPW